MPSRQLSLAAFTIAAALAVVAFIIASRPGAITAAAVLRRRRLEAETEADPPDPFAGAAFVPPVTKEICAEGTKRTYVAWKKVRDRLFQLNFVYSSVGRLAQVRLRLITNYYLCCGVRLFNAWRWVS
jgi:hypothetical protein